MEKGRTVFQEKFKYTRVSKLSEPRIVGIDTNVLIELIDNPFRAAYYSGPILQKGGFVHRRSAEPRKTEAVKYFVDERNFSVEGAYEKITDFCRENNLRIIEKNPCNRELLGHLTAMCRKHGIDIHPPDSFIIVDFKEAGVNTLYSTDGNFEKAARLLGMDTPDIPTVHETVERDIRRLFGRK